MAIFIINVLYGVVVALVASAVTWRLSHRGSPRSHENRQAESHRAAEIMARLHELATRVAMEVDAHSGKIEEINDTLTAADRHEPRMIVDVVAKLIETNQHMQEKLATTEDKLREQAQELQTHVAEARTDALTMLANRRALDDELVRRLAEFRRQGRTFSLIMADVDHFKKFNDAHGHQAGDEVLRGVAKALRRKMREMDLVARYGGEEFAIVLPATNLDDACKAALRACEALAKAHFRHDGEDLQVTASFGVAQVFGNEDATTLVMRADKALYASKAGGRNCAHWHDGTTVHRVDPAKGPPTPEAAVQRRSEPASGASEIRLQTRPVHDAEAVVAKPDVGYAAALEAASNLPQRSSFCQLVRNRAAEWKRGGPTFSVILLEVNQYDQGGELCGQQSREAATLAAARFLAATVREMDTVSHYAPGCFALLLPTAGLADAIRVAERLREEFSQYSFSSQGEAARFTLSAGVVQVTKNDDSIALLKRAEAALDAADRRGGNRAYCHDGERCAPITAMLETMDYLS